ncbi:MAG: DNA polymerase III subunit gamma/tau [Clostridiaceae bacterium]|nr:DNA polymerase III subunit gamma/tau [Clostridiaceae bacterium]
MSHIALYREWRPQTFSDVVAQKQVVYPLKQSIINGEIGHAYLFSGTRGTGKTSVAKIFAKAVNCLNPEQGNPCNQCEICQSINSGSLLDVMEIDAASNNSVDNIRRITDEIVFMPARAKYKVYIIDEVHMLSTGAFNALLKTLEEPPEHAIFILATTEPYRIPATVTSRCQRFDFRRIPHDSIIEKLTQIAQQSNIDIDEPALLAIAQLSDGALRDAISLLDQASSGIGSRITKEKLFDLVGIVQDQFMLKLTTALLNKDLQEVLQLIDELVMSGRDLERFVTEFAQFLRNLLVTKITGNHEEWFGFSQQDLEHVNVLAEHITEETLLAWIESISKLAADLRYSGDIRIAIEVGLIKILNQVSSTHKIESVGEQATNIPNQNKSVSEQVEIATEQDVSGLEQDEFANVKEEPLNEKTQSEIVEGDDIDHIIEDNIDDIIEDNTDYFIKDNTDDFIEDNADNIIEDNAYNFIEDKADDIIKDTTEEIGEDVAEDVTDLKSMQRKQWNQTLDYLVKEHRIDLKMLLSPATVESNNDYWKISYQSNLKSHCKTVGAKENKALIEQALQNVTGNNKIKLDICLINKEEAIKENLNPEEPAWMQEVRKMAHDLDIPIKMED